MSDELEIVPIDNTHRHEPTKEMKIDLINYIFSDEVNTDEERAEYLASIIHTYFSTFGIEMPHEITEEDFFKEILYPKNKTRVKKALATTKEYAVEYHKRKTKRIPLENDVTKMTLNKIVKKTWFGTRLDEMSIFGVKYDINKYGFITEPSLKLIIDKVLSPNRFDKYDPSVLIAFDDNINKINFIKDKLKDLLK